MERVVQQPGSVMPPPLPKDNSDQIEFKWGIKGGKGGKNKNVQFYKSFLYDGVEYSLYDSVYLFTEKEEMPHIGKLIKIFELASKLKKVKVLWFFRPGEVSNYLGDLEVHPKEIFLANGTGNGSTNVNPLEAIAGKCNVVCMSKDKWNREPLLEEVNEADHIFFRTFDVEKLTFSDKLGETIAEIDVELLLNKSVTETYRPLKINSDHGPNSGDTVDCKEKPVTLTADAVENVHSVVSSDILPGKNFPAVEASSDAGEKSPTAASDDKAPSQTSEKVVQKGVAAGTFRSSDDPDGRPSEKGDAPACSASVTSDRRESDIAKESQRHIKQSTKRKHADGSDVLDSRAVKIKRINDQQQTIAPNLAVDADSKKIKPKSSVPAAGVKVEGTVTKSSNEASLGLYKMRKNDDKAICLPNDRLQKTFHKQASEKRVKFYGQKVEVTRRPDVDSSKWFTNLAWEDRVKASSTEGSLVLIQNLDLSYCSSDVEDIVWHGFGESCSAKVIPSTTAANPLSGQALIIMKTKEAAERVVRELQEGCLLLQNGRPLIGRIIALEFPGKQTPFPGHLMIDKIRLQLAKEKREGVSTSHCAQPNTLEYDMAMEWRLLQERFDSMHIKIFKQQREELRDQQGKPKAKDH